MKIRREKRIFEMVKTTLTKNDAFKDQCPPSEARLTGKAVSIFSPEQRLAQLQKSVSHWVRFDLNLFHHRRDSMEQRFATSLLSCMRPKASVQPGMTPFKGKVIGCPRR